MVGIFITESERWYHATDVDEVFEKVKSVGTEKFQPDGGFAGAEDGGCVSGRARNVPVQF